MTSLQLLEMSLYDLIAKEIKRILQVIKKNTLAKVSLAVTILLALRKIILMRRVSSQEVKVLAETISSFYDKMANNNLKSVTILSNSIRYRDLSEKLYEAVLPKQLHSLLEEKLRLANIQYGYAPSSNTGNFFLIVLLWAIFGFLFFMFFKSDGQSEMNTSSKPMKPVTFGNVVGLEECKESLKEVIQYMRDPKKYQEIGARMRRGIIFYGPSGTGKTTLAKATAGEAGVPFFSCNASQFCEIYVGVGPKRVKDLFKKAKESAPSIIYIDQIDAIGNRKGFGMYNDGAGSQKNSTINQLLSEMDGFSSHEHVLVIASTNRLEMIDPALLRAGRFDLKIKVPLPTETERLRILKHHLQGKRYSLGDEYLKKVVMKLTDWSGAQLQNLANESVYSSLRLGENKITEETFNVTLQKLSQQFSGHH